MSTEPPDEQCGRCEGDRGDIGLAARGHGGQAGHRLGSEVVELVVGEAIRALFRVGSVGQEDAIWGESNLVGLLPRSRRSRGSGSVPAFWGSQPERCAGAAL